MSSPGKRTTKRRLTARTAIKKVETLVAAGKKSEATEALKEAISLLDQLAQRGTISGNSCSRKKAHLQHIVAGLSNPFLVLKTNGSPRIESSFLR
jgi:ribosomal protein S20